MTPTLLEWLNLVGRWVHVIAAIMWIGDSFLFMWLDSHLTTPEKPREGAVVGELWMVHSGGFYEVVKRKYLAPNELPKQLHWFKWESYTTWLSGVFLITVVYYLGGRAYLVDPGVADIGAGTAVLISVALLAAGFLVYDRLWMSPLKEKPAVAKGLSYALLLGAIYLVTHVFAGRAAFLQVGAMLATVMACNVFFRIIPSQRYMLAQTHAGQPVDTTLGLRAKQRSVHNHYLTLPVLFTMLSNHFPTTYGHRLNWVILALLIVVGATLKYVMNFRGQSRGVLVFPGFAALCAVLFLTLQATVPSTGGLDFSASPVVPFATVNGIVNTRCVTCHAQQPANPAFPVAPAGIMLDTPERIHEHADRILIRAVLTKTMPLGNITGITDEERFQLGAWVTQGASLAGADLVPKAAPVVAAAAPTFGSAAEEAQSVFTTRCVSCHGAGGKGDGPVGAVITPKPRNYTNHEWQASVTDDQLRKVIIEGGPSIGKSVMMPPNPDLAGKKAVVDEVVRIIRGLDGK
jgi:uncharacterized membrane protein